MTQEMFTRELERRAHDVHAAPLTLDDVRGRARAIRRGRRLASVTAAAAAVAVIAVPFTLSGGDDRSGPDPAPSPLTPTPSPSASGPVMPGSSVLHDGVLTHPDGSTTPLDVVTTDLQEFGVLTDGRVVVPVPGVHKIRVYGADGRLDEEYDTDLNTITMSADDTLAAWLDVNLRVVVLESGRAEPTTFEWGIPMPGEAYGSIDALYGSDCAAGGCTLLVGDFNTTRHVLTSVTEPAQDLTTSMPLRVASVSADGSRWAVNLPQGEDEQFGCAGIYDPAAAELVASDCDETLWSFSPDGQRVVSARGDNGMWSTLRVLDAGLGEAAEYGAEGRVYTGWGWQDAEHLLGVTVTTGATPEWSLVRITVGGQEEVVFGPVSGPDAEQGPELTISE